MQQMTPEACAEGNTTGKRLIDIRDGKSYWVAKLKDGKCWMTQNLDLDLTNITLTSTDSDVTISWTPNLMSELWDDKGGNSAVRYYDPGVKYCNTSGCNLTASANDEHDAQGNYYSWNAATAGTGGAVGTSGNAGGSICPKGWRLPIGGNSVGEFYQLLNDVSITDIINMPYYYVYGGFVTNSALSGTGSNGHYWSVAASSSINAYSLGFNNSTVSPSGSSGRYIGYSVRCVAR